MTGDRLQVAGFAATSKRHKPARAASARQVLPGVQPTASEKLEAQVAQVPQVSCVVRAGREGS